MRLATFNVENLFTRFRFARGVDPRRATEEGFTSEDLRFRLEDPESKRITADLLNGLDADVIALQEVEGLDTLKQFRDRFLGGRDAWPHALVIDGNDQRRIDVGLLSRFPIVHARSWQHLLGGDGQPVFDRDCLEADVEVPGLGVLTLFVNHFKSMRAETDDAPGRAVTRPRRVQQARAVMDIVRRRFGDDPGDAPFVVLGDLNDHVVDDEQGRSGILDLVRWDAVVPLVERLPERERWTHYFQGHAPSNAPPAYRQLDHVLASRRLAALNPGLPTIDRRGQPKRAEAWDGERLTGVGWHRPKASDHCPVVVAIDRL
ncbi:MAG: endonuclease/exonuclease/phosphatase family protein [Alphaproteobacteria bacterium]|nr:endonuclease/exonuclease/phosphatase family protein [Alphaproteobacteria bacterium]MCB9698036.1 endonuclease/exonuclease/phosphatase family protein [Alphaproteobacteria bacterium]